MIKLLTGFDCDTKTKKIKGGIRRREGDEEEELLCFKEWKEAR